MDVILYGWPYFALVCGLIGSLVLLLVRRPPGALLRRRDPAWLACLMLPVYMVHQFEEHGIDLLGRHYHFIAEMCGVLGHVDLAGCPADPAFILAVNVGGVWIAGLTAILWRRTNPLVGAFAFGIPLVNAFAHIISALRFGAYNSGVATAILVFLPLCGYALHTFWRAGLLDRRAVILVVVSGMVVHASLLGPLLAYERGFLPRGLMLAVQVANGLVPLVFATIVARMRRSQPEALPATPAPR